MPARRGSPGGGGPPFGLLFPGLMLPLLLLLPLPIGGAGGARAEPGPPGWLPYHDLHVVTADMAIEGSAMAGRLRFFKHELERALGPLVGADAVSLTHGAEADALVLRYLRDRLRIDVDGVVLEPSIVESGEDELDRHPTWWVVVRYQAEAPIERLTVRNTLLFELFDDQRNVMKFVRFPEQAQETVYFTPGESEMVVGSNERSRAP